MKETSSAHPITISETPNSVEAIALAATESLRHSAARAHDAILALGTENQSLKRDLEKARAEIRLIQAKNEQLHEKNATLEQNCKDAGDKHAALHSDLQQEKANLHHEREENRALRNHIEDLHFDLLAEDLPSLALKMAMRLTGAEIGLFTQADGDDALARVGFENLEEFLIQAVYDYSRQTAQSEEPTVENDSKKLPDGAGLVNLAALPFAVKGEMRGVLLLANKRNGPFTDAECQILLAIGQHAGLAMENAKLHRQLLEAYTSTVAVLADAIEAKDAYTRGHCEGVSRISVEVARRLGVQDKALDAVRYAALLHDVGKIGIPDGILLKPGKLMPEEFSIIQKHSTIGRDLIGRVPALSHISDAILHHHERFDGSGYPDGLDGESIPLAARIICAVDAFDAMTSPRPYREAVEWVVAFEELQRCAGTQFDPHIVNIVTQVLRETETEPATEEEKAIQP
ncbi:GAF domain-containing protein [Abditibacterium utsteinense]|uniref:GAF domain-containing protein n=1 Tax=Abditibacterium utsteinense TaxID=1960156 RepID=A0A2S8SPD4_9BACT|nr:HD domain-containing phosphohydrolase [Abditibacterium utsteinense]PQV62639.1 GAF domain-containing protein [Abditibacterium utsteinense]